MGREAPGRLFWTRAPRHVASALGRKMGLGTLSLLLPGLQIGKGRSWEGGTARQAPSGQEGWEEHCRLFSCSHPPPPPPGQCCHPPCCPAGGFPWSYLIAILEQKSGADTELQVFAITLINKVTVSAGGHGARAGGQAGPLS